MGILRFLIRRLLFAVVLILGVSAIIFFLLNAIGNPVDVMMADNPGITDEALAAVKSYYHLDASVGSRYLFWLGHVARLDFGTSISTNMPVGGMLLTWGAETLKLQIPAIVLALLLSIGFATIAATRQYSRTDFSVMSAALLGHSLPGFLLGVLLILIFAYWLGVFPSYGAYSTRNPLFGSGVADALWHMVLPLTMLTVFNTATLTLLLRGNLVDVLRQDFIMAARASGLPERRVVFHHALRNAIIPVLTYLGILFGLMLATAPVTESVFTWPGAGALYLAAIQALDYPVIMGETLVVTVMLVGFTLLTDLAYVVIDPADSAELMARAARAPGQLRQGWMRLRRNRSGMTGLVLIAFIVLVALIGPWLAPYAPNDQSAMLAFASRGAPSLAHPFGTDRNGYDVLTRVIYGAPTALAVGIGAMLVASVAGILIGGVAGWLGGLADEILMRVTDLFLVIPVFVMILAVVRLFGIVVVGTWLERVPFLNLTTIALLLGLFGWPPIARLARAEFLRLKGLDFVEAARCIGARPRDILLRHILPNAMPSLAVVIALGIGGAILAESMISFLGFGDPKAVSWGQLLYFNYQVLKVSPWAVLAPGSAIFITVLGFNLLADGLSDAFNPRLKQ